MIAAGVGNPPAPCREAGRQGRVQDHFPKRPTLAFTLPHAYPPGQLPERPSHSQLLPLPSAFSVQHASKTAQDASKMPPNRLLFGICFSMPFWIDFLSMFVPNLAPTWPPKSIKIHEKSMPRYLPIMTSSFNPFLIDFYCQLRPPQPSKSLFFLRKKSFFQKFAFRSWDRFLTDFGANLAPFYIPKSTKIL